jgi:sulfur relay (sulfurtransferase) DsrC/TusE family protein
MNIPERIIKVEYEHKETLNFIKSYYKKYKKFPTLRQVAKHIAMNHLKENKNYYKFYNHNSKGKEYLIKK